MSDLRRQDQNLSLTKKSRKLLEAVKGRDGGCSDCFNLWQHLCAALPVVEAAERYERRQSIENHHRLQDALGHYGELTSPINDTRRKNSAQCQLETTDDQG